MKKYACVILLAVTMIDGLAEEDLDRVWTNTEGKEIFGTYVNYDPKSDLVTIVKGGREYHVAFESLSEEDQDFVEEQSLNPAKKDGKDGKEDSSDLAAEAKKRGVNMQESEIFQAWHYNTTFIATSCTPIGLRSKLPDTFMIVGDVLKQRGGKETRMLKASLELVKFEWVIREGGRYRMPFYKASFIRPASPRNIRDAKKGR